jgi:hypothetical protein
MLEVAEVAGPMRDGTTNLGGEITVDCEDGLRPALKSPGYILTGVAREDGKIQLDAQLVYVEKK